MLKFKMELQYLGDSTSGKSDGSHMKIDQWKGFVSLHIENFPEVERESKNLRKHELIFIRASVQKVQNKINEIKLIMKMDLDPAEFVRNLMNGIMLGEEE